MFGGRGFAIAPERDVPLEWVHLFLYGVVRKTLFEGFGPRRGALAGLLVIRVGVVERFGHLVEGRWGQP